MTDDERTRDGTSAPAGADEIVLGPPPADMMDGWAGHPGPPSSFAPPPGVVAPPPAPAGPLPWKAVKPPKPPKPAKPPRGPGGLRRAVLVATAGGLAVGLAGGAVTGAVVADDQLRVDQLSAEVTGLEQDIIDAEEQRRSDVQAARRETEAALAEDLAAQQEELDAQAADLKARKGDLDSRESALDDREADLAVLEEQAADGSIPGDGLYLVGSEVEPGTYRASDGGDCYWERLSGASGDFGDLITNGFGAADATVTIQGSDYAFSSQSCGSWTRLD